MSHITNDRWFDDLDLELYAYGIQSEDLWDSYNIDVTDYMTETPKDAARMISDDIDEQMQDRAEENLRETLNEMYLR